MVGRGSPRRAPPGPGAASAARSAREWPARSGSAALPGDGDRRDGHRGADLGHLAGRAARGERRAGRSPGARSWVGVLLALAGVVLVSRDPATAGGRLAAGAGLALIAALGFGLFIVGLGAAAQESAAWATATARLSSVAVVAVALTWTRTAPRVPRRLILPVVTVGAFDTGANALIAVASTRGPIGIVGVLSSLYPLTTILLARAFLHERLGPTRTAGGLTALRGRRSSPQAAVSIKHECARNDHSDRTLRGT